MAQPDNLSEKKSVPIEDDPPTDDWGADGWSHGLAAQLAIVGSLLSRAMSAENATLSGKALRMDSEEVLLSAEESGWFEGTEVRCLQQSGWSAAPATRCRSREANQ